MKSEIGVAVLRHRLWDIDVVINRALVYGGLTALVVVTYLILVVSLGSLFQSQVNTISGLVATGIVALLFQPVRDRLQRAVDRLLYGERNDAAAVLTNLAQQMDMSATPAAILPNLVQTIAQTLKVPYVAIWLPDEVGRLEPVAVIGQAPANVRTIPLTYQQENLGRLVVSPLAGRYEVTGLRFDLDLPAARPDLPAAIETAIYRIAQEAITNVVHHAGASLCTVWLLCANGHATLEVRDDGSGLRPGYQSGVGMHAMRERAAELDGELLVARLPDGGTLIKMCLPLVVNDE